MEHQHHNHTHENHSHGHDHHNHDHHSGGAVLMSLSTVIVALNAQLLKRQIKK